MKIQGITICNNVNIKEENYAYGLVTEMSRVVLLSGEELKDYMIGEELLEARFFDKEKELHIWREDDLLKSVLVTETKEAKPILKEYPLTSAVSPDGKWICTAQYPAFDEDGQAYIGLTRLCGVKGKGEEKYGI